MTYSLLQECEKSAGGESVVCVSMMDSLCNVSLKWYNLSTLSYLILQYGGGGGCVHNNSYCFGGLLRLNEVV
jgi:hypothetical protein